MLKILVPTDFSENAHAALQYAAQLALPFNAQLLLLHVIARPWMPGDTAHNRLAAEQEYELQQARMQLNRQAEYLQTELESRGQRLRLITKVVTARFVPGVANMAEQENCRLIVMGTKGATGLKRMFIGSNTTDLMEHTPVPLVIVPDRGVFTGLKQIGLALEPGKPYLLSPHFEIINELATNFGSEVVAVSVLRKDQGFGSDRPQAGMALKQHLRSGVPLKFLTLAGDDPIEVLTDYAAQSRPDLLVLHPQRRSVWQLMFGKRASRELAFEPVAPIMVMPLPYVE